MNLSNSVAPGGTCTINFSPSNTAGSGDGVNIVVGSNATQSGNGNVYINGGVTAVLSGDHNPFTDINQTETLTLTNTSDEHGAQISTVGFTYGTKTINNIIVVVVRAGYPLCAVRRLLQWHLEPQLSGQSKQRASGSDVWLLTFRCHSSIGWNPGKIILL